MEIKTIEDAKRWAEEHASELDSARLACEVPEVQSFNRMAPELSKSLWNSGCWLDVELRSLGATDEQVKSLQFAHGQRAFAGCAWKPAVDYVNEFAATGDTQDKPGAELGEKICVEVLGEPSP